MKQRLILLGIMIMAAFSAMANARQRGCKGTRIYNGLKERIAKGFWRWRLKTGNAKSHQFFAKTLQF